MSVYKKLVDSILNLLTMNLECFNPFHATHEISRLEAQSHLVQFNFILNVSLHITTVTGLASQ